MFGNSPHRHPQAEHGDGDGPIGPVRNDGVSYSITEGISSWLRIMAGRQPQVYARDLLAGAAQDLFGALKVDRHNYPNRYDISYQAIVDGLFEIADLGDIDRDEAQAIFAEAARPRTPASPAVDGGGSVKAPEAVKKEYPDPCRLPEALLPVAAFDLDLLPEKLRPWASDIAERMQCPPDYIGVSIMAGLGSVIGSKILIRPKVQDDWEVVANQWALVIGRPGVLKSPAMEEAIKPLKRLCAEAEREFKASKSTHELDRKIAELQAKDAIDQARGVIKGKDKSNKDAVREARELLAKNDPDRPEPTLRRYIANDTNIASFGVLLQQNPDGMLVYRDELVSLLRSLDQEERESEKAFYLTGWNGNSGYTFDRIARGLHLSIERVCISMLGSTQPGKISEYLAQAVHGGRGDDGLIQRFGLLVWPDVGGEWKHVDRWPLTTARAAAFEVFERLDKLDWRDAAAKRDRGQDGDDEGLPYLRFNIEAYDDFVFWRNDLEKRIRGDLHPALESHLAKYRKLVPGLSLICHLADGGTGPVGGAALQKALRWAQYLETHACRAYGSVTAAEASTAKTILDKLRSGDLKSQFSSRDVWRPGWSRLKDRDAVHAGLRMLVDYDHLSETIVQTAGRPATLYTVNPKALKA